jgi:hypothetical protein
MAAQKTSDEQDKADMTHRQGQDAIERDALRALQSQDVPQQDISVLEVITPELDMQPDPPVPTPIPITDIDDGTL